MREPYERIEATSNVPLLLTCEHASNELPGGWSEEDSWLAETHWAFDIGAAALTRLMAAELGTAAVLGTLSRLWVDLNRGLRGRHLFRSHADGREVALNRGISEETRRRRLEDAWEPYHAAVSELVSTRNVFSVHSFTPVWEGEQREMEIGVLFYKDDRVAHAIAGSLHDEGYKVALNEPYSGARGTMMYSPHRHAEQAGTLGLEIEVRQDLAGDPSTQPRLVAAVIRALRRADLI